MSKAETKADVLINRPVNQIEHQELAGMKRQLNELRYQLGLNDEKVRELEAAKVQTFGLISAKKKEFTDRLIGISKSYGIKLGEVTDGVFWQFNEDTLEFQPSKAEQPQAAPNVKPVEPTPPSNGSAEAKSDEPVTPPADQTN